MAIKDITYKIKAETAQFEASMARVGVNFDKLGVTSLAVGKRLGVAFAAAGAAVAALTVKSINNIAALEDQAIALDINISSLQAMSMVAREAGASQGALESAMQRSQRAIFDAASGAGDGSNAFNTLGLNVSELLNLKPDEQFNLIAGSLSQLENTTQRNALAMQIFGRGAVGILQMFDDYNDKLEEARLFNERFNISLSNIDAATVGEATDYFDRLTSIMTGLGNTIAVQVSPVITQLSKDIMDSATSGEDMSRIVGDAIEWVSRRVDELRLLIIGLDVVWNGLKWQALEALTAITKAIDTVYNSFKNFDSNMVKIKGRAYEALGLQTDELQKTYDALKAREGDDLDLSKGLSEDLEKTKDYLRSLNDELVNFEKTSDKIKRAQESARGRAASSTGRGGRGGAGGGLIPGTAEAEKDMGMPWLDPGNAYFMTEDYKRLQKEMFDEGKKEIDETANAAKELGLTFTSAFEDAVVGGKKFSDVLQGLSADIARLIMRKAVTEPFADAASGLLGGLFKGAAGAGAGGSMAAPSANFIGAMPAASSGGLGSFFGGFFANGGNPPVGKVSVVGERGAELFIPKTAGTIIPNNKISTGGNTFNLSYNFATGIEAAAQGEILKALPSIVAASKRGVLEAINRGGTMSRAVGVQ